MFPTDEEVSGAQKKEVRRLQQKVAKYVGDELLAPGKSARFKGVAISTLAYACALKPGAHIVKVLLRRLLDEEEAALTPQANARDGGNPEEGRDRGKDNKQKIDFKGRRTESCLAQLFGLSARAQRSKELEDGILSAGVVNSVRTFAIMLAREDIIVILATSIATRQHCTTFEDDAPLREAMEDMQGMKGVLSEVHGLVSEQHAHEFLRNGRQLLKRLEEYTATSFRAFTAQLCKSDKALLTTINKQAMKGTLGSTEREGLRKTRNGSIDFRQSNKTKLDPGHGLLPHIATTAVDVAFNAKAWCEWEIHEDNPPREDDPTSGKRARTLATEFSVLVVDRFIAELSAGDGAHARASLVNFESLFAAVDPTGILFGVLKKNPDALSVDGQPFFDAARQEVVKQAARIGVPAVAKDPTVGGEDTGTTEEMQDDGPKGSQQSGRSERKENVLLTRTQRPDAVSVVNDPYNVSLIRSQRANAATIVSDPVRARFPLEVLRSLCLVETNGKRARGKSVTFTISNLDSDGDDGGNSDDDDKEELPMSTSLNRKATRSDEESDTCTGGGVDESALSAEPTNHRNGEAKGRAKRKQGTATGSREDPSDNSKRHATTNNAVGRVSQAEQHYESGEDFEDTPWTRPCCCCRCRRLFCCHF